MYLLGNSLLFTVDLPRGRMVLSSFDTCKVTTDMDMQPSSTFSGPAPVWKYAIVSPDSLYEVSGPFNCSDSTRFVISGSSKILGVIIHPHLPADTTKVIDLMNIPRGIRFAAQSCYHRTVYRPGLPRHIGEASAITLRWPDEDGESTVAPIPPEKLFYPAILSDHITGRANEVFTVLMDDASGRIVTASPDFGIMEIWETVPIT